MSIFATMEKLIRHIETLLRRHDYVIVPELGGFVLQRQSSVITDEGIEPPLTVVSYNPLMKTSDGLLAIELSRAEHISFREAVQLITAEVETAKVLLEKNKKLELGKLGFLSIDSGDKVAFRPSANAGFIPSNFGLETLHVAAIQKADEEEKRVIRIVIPSRRKLTRYAAAAAVIAGLVFGAPKMSEAYRDFANLYPASLFHKTEIQPENQTAQPVQTPAEEPETAVAVAEPSHHVIVSCMATLKDAEAYQEWLKSLNYQHARILPPVKTYRIAIESFTTKEEAIVYMQELRNSKPQFADAWVLSDSGK